MSRVRARSEARRLARVVRPALDTCTDSYGAA